MIEQLQATVSAATRIVAETHDLGVLLDEVKTAGHEVADEVAAAVEWTPYAVRNRYPFFDPRPAVDRGAALELVLRVRSCAQEIAARA